MSAMDIAFGVPLAVVLVAGWFAMGFVFDEYIITQGCPSGGPYGLRRWAWWAVLPWVVVALGAWHFARALADMWRMHREVRRG